MCYSENIIYRISMWIPGAQIFSKDFNHRFSVNEDGLLYLHREYVWMTEFRKKMNYIELEHKVYTRNQKKPSDLGDVDDRCDEILVTFWLSWQASANRPLRNNESEPVWGKSGKKDLIFGGLI